MTQYQQPPPPPQGQPQYQQPPQQQQQPPQQQYQQAPPPQQQYQQQAPPSPQGPQQTPGYWPDQQQTPPQYQQGNPQFSGQQPAPGAPTYNAVDDAAAAAMLEDNERRTQERQQSGGSFGQWLSIPGPNGQKKWDASVPVGYEGYTDVAICAGWVPGVVPFAECYSHFIKTRAKPNGQVLNCTGDKTTCLLDLARALAIQSQDPNISQSGKTWGKQRRQTIYNVIDLTNPQSHYGQDGTMRAHMLGAGAHLQTALKRMFDLRGGISQFVNPQQFRPVRISKKKTGPDPMNVEWGAIDLDAIALDQYFWPALQNLTNLADQVKAATTDDIMAVVLELGWPVPDMGQAQAQVPANYNAGPNPPYQNPHQQPAGALPPAPVGGAPQPGALPPHGQAGAYPPPGQMAPPQMQTMAPPPSAVPVGPPPGQMPPPPQAGQMPPPPGGQMPPPPQAGQMAPPPPAMAPNQGTPPPMNPPPVSSMPPQGVPPGNPQQPF